MNFQVVESDVAGLGAFINGLDLLNIKQEQNEQILSLLWKYKVLSFTHQPPLNFEELTAVASKFGEIFKTPAQGRPASKEFPWIQGLDRGKGFQEYFIYGGGWHADNAALLNRPAYTMLYSVIVPPEGGDTLFVDQGPILNSLDKDEIEILRNSTANYSWTNQGLHESFYSKGDIPFGSDAFVSKEFCEEDFKQLCLVAPKFVSVDQDFKEKRYISEQNCIFTHPRTQKECLNITPSYTNQILSPNCEICCDGLLRKINQKQVNSTVFRLKWKPNMITIWDNRQVLHKATYTDPALERHMFRIMVADPEDEKCQIFTRSLKFQNQK